MAVPALEPQIYFNMVIVAFGFGNSVLVVHMACIALKIIGVISSKIHMVGSHYLFAIYNSLLMKAI